jgi:glycerol-3-phosphate acyltransferase PlsX
LRIGIDLMGSESSPAILFEAVLQASEQIPGVTLIVFATQAAIDSIWINKPTLASLLARPISRIEFRVVSEIIEMSDEPLIAIRQKKHSSLIVGMRLLKKRFLDAFISAGNTGALIASATLTLPLLPGIKRPALLAALPTEKGDVAVVDVGGNVSCKAYHLVQFAQIGAAYQRCCRGIKVPTVGLLNIGVESKKGTSEVRQAYQILQEQMSLQSSQTHQMHFIGNIEGREVFQGKADVLVTDGFTGNVLLKSSEGVSSFILEHLNYVLGDILPQQKQAILNYLHYHFDYEEYAGAIVCGVDRIAIKCHGKSSVKGMLNAIKGASELIKTAFIDQIKQQLALI